MSVLDRSYEADEDPSRPRPIAWDDYESRSFAEWGALLDSDPAEASAQAWLELHPSFLPGGFGDIGPGGHHGSEWDALFREAPLKGLGKDRRPDFMWVTRSSSLITPILIEIEKPSRRWFKSDGRPTRAVVEAIDQLTDWKVWFSSPENQSIFRSTFMLGEKYENRALEPHYVLIFGRSSEFGAEGPHANPDWLRYKRDFMRRENENFMTFDSLRPHRENDDAITLSMTTNGPALWAVSPTFGTGPTFMRAAERLLDVDAGLARSTYIGADRRQYLTQRFKHWKDESIKERTIPGAKPMSLSRE